MSYELIADERHKLVKLLPHGMITKEEMWKAREDVAERLNSLGYKLVLLDMREYTMNMPVIERYECWTTLSKSFPLGTRIALLTKSSHPQHETHIFMETTLTNHSFQSNLFTNEKDAFAWLGGKLKATH
jgi:hypothetical protein